EEATGGCHQRGLDELAQMELQPNCCPCSAKQQHETGTHQCVATEAVQHHVGDYRHDAQRRHASQSNENPDTVAALAFKLLQLRLDGGVVIGGKAFRQRLGRIGIGNHYRASSLPI